MENEYRMMGQIDTKWHEIKLHYKLYVYKSFNN